MAVGWHPDVPRVVVLELALVWRVKKQHSCQRQGATSAGRISLKWLIFAGARGRDRRARPAPHPDFRK
ncbi:hypothetical protein, partial [Bradyrhizobium sp. STM 3809]|uniref:hypothetical protein n=1 Tax=Bradyrhizobium sp. STM 3809 TaxID=551936 RepID=UPI001AEC30DC